MKTVTVLLGVCALASAAPASIDATYSDAVARSKMLPLASAAYAKNPQNCLTNKFTNAVLKRQVNVKCDAFKSDICSGYSAVLNGDKAIVLSFRGTDGFLQLIEEANKSVFESQTAWIAGGKVSKYIYDAFMGMWNGGMKDDFNTLRAKYPTYQVWVTGHSLGGAMASLAASYIVAANLAPAANVELVTFGQPRTGNKDFAAAHDKQMESWIQVGNNSFLTREAREANRGDRNETSMFALECHDKQYSQYMELRILQKMAYTFRVTHWRDVVPHIPLEGMEGYYHHKYEAFYHNNMKNGASYKVCTGDEDKGCSDGLDITTSISDHLHYFDVDVSGFGEKGCK